ncbi:MAG: hypothetical protein M1820_002411 [Bogoriella megaspora]|nr:MAG: hypothetical protein M1820_002411 [Bogoriella megaspora]
MSAPWTMFSDGAAAYIHDLGKSDLASDAGIDDRSALSSLARAIADIDSVRVAMIDEYGFPLLPLLRRFRTKRSSDPRDKVFALLGLADRRYQENLGPDYRLSKSEVMFQTTVTIMTETSTLDALAGTVAGPESTPSWTTNWDDYAPDSDQERLSCLHLYNASDNIGEQPWLNQESRLNLRGYYVDTISFLDTEAPTSGLSRMRGVLDKTDAFWRTICADLLYIEQAERQRRA